MNTTTTTDEMQFKAPEKPGLQLANIREKKGYSQEYVAGKLHLRVRLIELLEADDYDQMPEPVFIKGYFRAYAKLLGEPADPLLDLFNASYSSERKVEKTLWQGRRESHARERFVRLLTGVIALVAVVGIGLWWQKNKEQSLFGSKNTPVLVEEKAMKSESEYKLTDLSKMHSVLSPTSQQAPMTPLETHGG